ncbi:MAG: hypothetical protein H7A39_07315 [Chlamydiales bacterium]|nr:hypothetical protein [Chlamydiales bacterium]
MKASPVGQTPSWQSPPVSGATPSYRPPPARDTHSSAQPTLYDVWVVGWSCFWVVEIVKGVIEVVTGKEVE